MCFVTVPTHLKEGRSSRGPFPHDADTWQAGMILTSEDGELGMDGNLPMRVLSNTLVNVLIPGSPEWLDPQNSTCAFIKFDCLEDKGKERQ